METSNKPERRKYKRINIIHLSIPIELKINNNSKDFISGTIINLSANGIRIKTYKRITQNSIINFKLKVDKIKTENIMAKIVWLKEKNGSYYTGLQFINISPKDFFNIYNYIKDFSTKNIKD